MQQTRLNDLLTTGSELIISQLRRRWYVHSLRLIALLGGFLGASLISTWAGQRGILDITISIILLAFIEGINWLIYGQQWLTGKASLNLFKIGLLFGLAVEAFKLSS